MNRLPLLTEGELDAEQKRLHQSITSGARARTPRQFPLTNPDGSLNGPFNALLYNPRLGNAVQELGAMLRFGSNLPGTMREAAILTVAQHWRANYEWFAHAMIARKEGISDADIAAIKAGRAPHDNRDLALVQRFATELIKTGRVGKDTYAKASDKLGLETLVELVVLVGYYGLVSGLLNTFEVTIPDGEESPFGD